MPWKFILFIICIVFVVLFIGFNIDNKCSISLGIYTFTDVPIFMSIFLSFAIGVFVMIPFLFGKKTRKDKKEKIIGKKNDNSSTELTSKNIIENSEKK